MRPGDGCRRPDCQGGNDSESGNECSHDVRELNVLARPVQGSSRPAWIAKPPNLACVFGRPARTRHAGGGACARPPLPTKVLDAAPVHSEISTPHPSPLPVRGGEGEKAHVLPQVFTAPIAQVERRVGEVFPDGHQIGLEVGRQIRPAFFIYPNGVMAFSPGLVRAGLARGYPGKPSQQFINPE